MKRDNCGESSPNYHAMMRFWIVKWLWRHTKVYNTFGSIEKYDEHIELMAKQGTAGTHIELQAASDIFFAVTEIFTVDNAKYYQNAIRIKPYH